MEERTKQDSVRSWLCVLGASFALFCTVGFLNAFGVFQQYYSTYLPGRSNSDISWLGSVSLCILFIGGPAAGILVDKFGPTIPLCVGSVAEVLALFMTSLCTQYYQLLLAQGLLLGVGMCLITSPALAVVSRRMTHRRGLALGLTIGGSSIGGVIWPIMLERLLNYHRIGFGWTVRSVAFAMIPLLSTACLTIIEAPYSTTSVAAIQGSTESGQESEEQVVNEKNTDSRFAILKNKAFIFLCLGLAMGYLGLLTPIYYVSTYAVDQGLPSSTAFYLLSGLNASSFFGRVIPGHLADRYGHFNLCTLGALVSGIIGFTWTKASTLGALAVWCLAYGFASGSVMSLQGACAGKIAAHQHQGLAIGFAMGSVAIASLVGTPISGQILGHSGYLALSMWTGATLLVGSCILGAARLCLNSNISSPV